MTFHDLRHLNASVMAALRIPDKYAQERGGWKSDKIMKKYTPRPSPKSVLRLIIKLMDILIILQILSRKICRGKIQSLAYPFGKEDGKKSQKEFMKFIEEHRIAT